MKPMRLGAGTAVPCPYMGGLALRWSAAAFRVAMETMRRFLRWAAARIWGSAWRVRDGLEIPGARRFLKCGDFDFFLVAEAKSTIFPTLPYESHISVSRL